MTGLRRVVGATATEAWTQARRVGLREIELLVLAPATVRDRDRDLDRAEAAERDAAGARAASDRWFPIDAWFDGGVDGVWAWGAQHADEAGLFEGGADSPIGRALARLEDGGHWVAVPVRGHVPPHGLEGLSVRLGPGGHVELRALWFGEDAVQVRAALLGLGRIAQFAAEVVGRPPGPLSLTVRSAP